MPSQESFFHKDDRNTGVLFLVLLLVFFKFYDI